MSDLIRPRVSFITASYNAAHHLPRLIASLRAQTYPELEWIVIDGGSTDGTLELLKDSSDVLTRWISEPDNGIYDAWNKGLALAHGEWIGFVGADDCFTPGALAALADATSLAGESLDFVSGRIQLTRCGKAVTVIGSPWKWSKFRRYMCVAHTCALHNARYFERYGRFDPAFRISGDYELLLRAGADLKAGFVSTVLAHSELGGVSNRDAAVFRENLRAKLRHRACGVFHGLGFMTGAWLKWRLRQLCRA